jgi:hypothetical protein
VVINSILWGDTPDEIYINDDQSPEMSYSDIQGGYKGTGNININPLFVDPAGGDFRLRQPPCQFLPFGAGNPCVDGGDPNSRITGSTRSDALIDRGVPDMGYHYPHRTDFPAGGATLEAPAGGKSIGR